ncbi:MAG TPA: TauD/TfdA family dioxygenase [Gallionellaceae bacterium]
MASPFDLHDEASYQAWRKQKLAQAPASARDLIVEIDDPRQLTAAEHAALLDRIRRCNMVIYASRRVEADKDIARKIGQQFGLDHLNANWLAGEDGISQIEVKSGEPAKGFIPYTNKPIKWHTDGYYNPPAEQIRGMVLHCVRSAGEGGVNRLMDHEMLYLLLRDLNPEHIRALSAPDAMTIPARTDEEGVARAEQTGPVFSVDPAGHLHMRYTARTRSIEWKKDAATQAAVAALEQVLASDSPYIYSAQLQPGMGLLCNNVLHDRSGFVDDAASPRLLYRARYFDRIAAT